MRRSAESNVYSPLHSPSIMTMQASRFRICVSVGNGIRYERIRVFKKSSLGLSRRQFTSDDGAVAARVPRACIGELQATRLPLQKLSIQGVEESPRRPFHLGIPPASSGYFKNLDLVSNAPERALLRGRGDAVCLQQLRGFAVNNDPSGREN